MTFVVVLVVVTVMKALLIPEIAQKASDLIEASMGIDFIKQEELVGEVIWKQCCLMLDPWELSLTGRTTQR